MQLPKMPNSSAVHGEHDQHSAGPATEHAARTHQDVGGPVGRLHAEMQSRLSGAMGVEPVLDRRMAMFSRYVGIATLLAGYAVTANWIFVR